MKDALSLLGRNRARLFLLATIATGVLGMQAGRGTMAYFTTQTTSTANTFTAGTLHLQATDADQSLLNSVSASISFVNMKPGDTVYAPLEIDNVGSLDANYGVKYSTTTSGGQNLAPGLSLAIKRIGTGNAAVAADCTSTNFSDAAKFQADVRTAAAMVAAGETVVDVAGGSPIGLLHSAADVLCMKVVFTDPGSASNTYNNPTLGDTNTTVTFTVDGLASAAVVING